MGLCKLGTSGDSDAGQGLTRMGIIQDPAITFPGQRSCNVVRLPIDTKCEALENCKTDFDLWQVKSDTILNNMMITDDPAKAKAAGDALWTVTKDWEKPKSEFRSWPEFGTMSW